MKQPKHVSSPPALAVDDEESLFEARGQSLQDDEDDRAGRLPTHKELRSSQPSSAKDQDPTESQPEARGDAGSRAQG